MIYRKDEVTDKSEKINEKSKEHIAAINKSKQEISGYMAKQFDLLSFTANGLINEAEKIQIIYFFVFVKKK